MQGRQWRPLRLLLAFLELDVVGAMRVAPSQTQGTEGKMLLRSEGGVKDFYNNLHTLMLFSSALILFFFYADDSVLHLAFIYFF